MKKTITLLTLTLCLSLTAIAQKTDTIKGKPNTDTIVVPASAKFINIGGAVYDARAFKQIPVFLTADVLELIVSAMINGNQPQYNAQQMQQHVSITSQLQKLLPPKK